MKKKVWITGAAVLVLASGLLLIPAKETTAGTLPSGFFVGGMELAGLSEEEADQKIEEYISSISGQSIILTIDGNEIATTAEKLGFSWANREEIEAAQAEYAGGNLLRRYLNQKRLEKTPVELEIETSVDAGKVEEFVESHLSPYTREAQDAVLTRENGEFQVTESVAGMEVDIAATKKALDEAIQGGLDAPVKVAAVVTETQPARSTEELATVQDVLGTFSTTFSTGNVSRSKNLRTGASKVDGTVLMPGEEFSAYTWLTPFTIENGYAAAGSYANGQVVDTVGGGACQLCTTLYNAALLSELEITQRQNHSMVVGYVKPSQDSAIAGTVKDLKFKNSNDTPIYLEGVVNGGVLTFTIYGKETRPANREIKFVSETVSVKDPGEPIMKQDPSLAPGAQVKEQSAHQGLQSRLWKYVYVDGAETEKLLISSDTYMASKAIYRVGPAVAAADAAPADPGAAAEPGETEAPAESQPQGPAGPAATGPGAESPSGSASAEPAAVSPAPETASPAPADAEPAQPAAPGMGV